MAFESYELSPRYDAHKSFYGKARVEARDGVRVLYSYGSPVAKVDNLGGVELGPAWDYSATTLRHVREFLLQAGLYAGSKADMAANYGPGERFYIPWR